MSDQPEPITSLLKKWRDGEKSAGDRVVEDVYGELRRLAAIHMRRESPGHTLDPTALVNELYLRLFRSAPVDCQNRSHFLAIAAQQLRRILINHARDRQADKRGGKRLRLSLTSVEGLVQPIEQDMIDLDQALDELAAVDGRAAQVVELRFLAGATESEAATALGISVATLKRDWEFARAWLIRRLRSVPSQVE